MTVVAKASRWSFARAFREHLFAAMSGGFSVPFAAAAVFLDNKYAQLIFGCLAFGSAWFAAYRIWKSEREQVISLQQQLKLERASERDVGIGEAVGRDFVLMAGITAGPCGCGQSH